MPRFLIALMVGAVGLGTAAVAPADAGLVRTAQADEAPATMQDTNPSQAEPMMLGPTHEDNAASYSRDFVACESQPGDQRNACRAAVDRQYRPEVTNLSSGCDGLDPEAKAECLRRDADER